MLKVILDTNLFRRKELKHLEDYNFSRIFENLYNLIRNQKVDDVEICIDQMALLEYVEQVGNWYEEDIVQRYNQIFNVVCNVYPIQKMYFRSKNDYIETYRYELLENLKQRGIKLIETIPTTQNGGVSIVKLVEKTIKNIPPFDKLHNKDLKDALISETINTKAESDQDNLYVFITLNRNDFKDNIIEIPNYKIETIYPNDELLQILDIIKSYGSHVDDDVYFRELLNKERFDKDIKQFVEGIVLDGNYYNEVPTIKQNHDKYVKKYETIDDNSIRIYFYLLDGDIEYECGIEYSLSYKKQKILKKFITYTEESSQEVYRDEF